MTTLHSKLMHVYIKIPVSIMENNSTKTITELYVKLHLAK
jgi:hypothetical protein